MLYLFLYENVLNMLGVCFRIVFSGGEFFLKDYVVKNEWMLLGVVYLEMVWVAVEYVVEMKEEGIVCLKYVVWVCLFIVMDEIVELYFCFYDEENGEMGFMVYGELVLLE